MTPASTPLNDDQLLHMAKLFLDELMNTLANTNPALVATLGDKKADLIKLLVATLKTNGQKITLGNMKDKSFVNNMAMAMNTALQSKMELDLDPKLIEALKKICGDKDINEIIKKLKLDPNELEKIFTPEQLKQIKELLMKKNFNLLMKESIKLLENKNKPASEDPYSQLLGMLTSSQTGSIAVVVVCFLGNGNAFPDFSPDNGYAHIDDINNVNTMFGDSMGMEASTKQNFEKMSGNLFDIADVIHNNMGSFLNTPRATPGQHQ